MKTSRDSLLLMMLPVVAILAFGWWRQMNPPTPPPAAPKLSLTLQIRKEPIYPVDVWAGVDTKIKVEARPTDFSKPVEWLDCLRVVARKDRHERILFSTGEFSSWNSYRGKNWNSYQRWMAPRSRPSLDVTDGWWQGSFALRKVPKEWGEIWIIVDIGIRPPTKPHFEGSLSAASVAKLKAQGGITWATKELRLRRDGEVIKTPLVSTNPLLGLEKWQVKDYSPRGQSETDRVVTLQVFDTGTLPPEKELFPIHVSPPFGILWKIVDEKGQNYDGAAGNAQIGNPIKDRRTYEVRFGYSSKVAPNAKRLRLRGQLSCDNRWPLTIDIPLIDRTKTSSKVKSRLR